MTTQNRQENGTRRSASQVDRFVEITIRARGIAGNGWRGTFSPFSPTVGAVHHPRPRFDRDASIPRKTINPFLTVNAVTKW